MLAWLVPKPSMEVAVVFLRRRVDNGWQELDIDIEGYPNLPSPYVDRSSVVSAVFDEGALRMLVGVMGAERVMMGADHPFPARRTRDGLSDRQVRWIGRARDALTCERQHTRVFNLADETVA